MSFIHVENVTFRYGTDDPLSLKEALSGVSLAVEKGEFVALLGHNGCGKSTLAKHFNAMLLPTSGKVFVDGMDTAEEALKYEIRRRVGLVLQNPDNQLVASIVEEDVLRPGKSGCASQRDTPKGRRCLKGGGNV